MFHLKDLEKILDSYEDLGMDENEDIKYLIESIMSKEAKREERTGK